MRYEQFELKKIQTPNPRLRWLQVLLNGIVVGYIEKMANSRSEINPFKAFAASPDGTFGRYLGAHYGSKELALGFIIDALKDAAGNPVF